MIDMLQRGIMAPGEEVQSVMMSQSNIGMTMESLPGGEVGN